MRGAEQKGAGLMSETAELYRLEPSNFRRAVGVTLLGLQAVGLIWLGPMQSGIASPVSVILIGLSVASVLLAVTILRQSGMALVLTQDALMDTSGAVVVALIGIERVDRGAFAFKPSNGFTLRLKEKAPSAWRPGLWWRYSNRVGIGGLTAPLVTRKLAEAIEARLITLYDL